LSFLEIKLSVINQCIMWLSECATLCANCHLHVSVCLAPSHNSRMASWNRKCTVGIFFYWS